MSDPPRRPMSGGPCTPPVAGSTGTPAPGAASLGAAALGIASSTTGNTVGVPVAYASHSTGAQTFVIATTVGPAMATMATPTAVSTSAALSHGQMTSHLAVPQAMTQIVASAHHNPTSMQHPNTPAGAVVRSSLPQGIQVIHGHPFVQQQLIQQQLYLQSVQAMQAQAQALPQQVSLGTVHGRPPSGGQARPPSGGQGRPSSGGPKSPSVMAATPGAPGTVTLKTVAPSDVVMAGNQAAKGGGMVGAKTLLQQQQTVYGTKVLQRAAASGQPLVIGQIGVLSNAGTQQIVTQPKSPSVTIAQGNQMLGSPTQIRFSTHPTFVTTQGQIISPAMFNQLQMAHLQQNIPIAHQQMLASQSATAIIGTQPLYIRSAGPIHHQQGIMGNVQTMVHSAKAMKPAGDTGGGVQMKSTGTQVKTVVTSSAVKGVANILPQTARPQLAMASTLQQVQLQGSTLVAQTTSAKGVQTAQVKQVSKVRALKPQEKSTGTQAAQVLTQSRIPPQHVATAIRATGTGVATRPPTVMVQPKPHPIQRGFATMGGGGGGVRQLVPGTGLIGSGPHPRMMRAHGPRILNIRPPIVAGVSMAGAVRPPSASTGTGTAAINNGNTDAASPPVGAPPSSAPSAGAPPVGAPPVGAPQEASGEDSDAKAGEEEDEEEEEEEEEAMEVDAGVSDPPTETMAQAAAPGNPSMETNQANEQTEQPEERLPPPLVGGERGAVHGSLQERPSPTPGQERRDPGRPSPAPGEKQQAIVKPQILTHIIEGFVIQEAREPFPVQRCSVMSDFISGKQSDANSNDSMGELGSHSDDSASNSATDNGEKMSFSEHLSSMDLPKLKCEFCGKMAFAKHFRRSKRFCSTACAKRYNVGCSRRMGLFQRTKRVKAVVVAGVIKKRVCGGGLSHMALKKGWKRGQEGRVSTGPIQRSPETSVLAAVTGSPGRRGGEELGEAEETGPLGGLPMPSGDPSAPSGETTTTPTTSSDSERSSSPSGQEESSPPRSPPELERVEMDTDPTPTAPTPRRPLQQWSVQEVYDFINHLPGCAMYAEEFNRQEIDGQALMLLKEDHLMTTMSIKLGPALKICAKINTLKDD